jgi:hypothetical protein
MFQLASAINQMGGVAKLNAGQVERLTSRVNALAAAGAKVPKSLAGIGAPGIGAGLKAAGTSAVSGLGPGGAVGVGLAAIGPAGIAAAAGIGAISIAAAGAVKAIEAVAERADSLINLSSKTGLTTDFLQQLEFAGGKVGVSLDQASSAVITLQRTLGEAAQGSEQARQKFADIGVSWKELQGLRPEQQFALVAQALGTIPDQERLVAAGADLMGKGFADLIPLIKSDLPSAFEDARAAGVVMSEEMLKKAAAVGSAFERLGAAAGGLKLQIGSAFLQILSGGGDPAAAIDKITAAVAGLSKLVANPAFQVGLRAIAALGTFGASEIAIQGVGQLAASGQGAVSGAAADQARAAAVAATQQQIKTEAAQRSAVAREEAETAKKLGAERVASQKKETAERIALAKQATAESRALEQVLTDAQIEFHKRVTAEREKDLEKQVTLAEAAERRILADFLLANNIKLEQINALGEQIQIVSQAEMDAARRRASTAVGGSGQLLSDIPDEGLPTQFFSRFADVRRELEQTQGHLFRVKDSTTQAAMATQTWAQRVQTLADLSQGLPGIFGKLAFAIGGVGAAFDQLRSIGIKTFGDLKAKMKTFEGKMQVGAAAGQALGAVGGLLGGQETKAGRAFGGAAKGAQIGARAGPYGMVIGAVAGGLIGLFKKPAWEKAAKTAAKILGHDVPKEMAEQIMAEAKATGKSVAQVAEKMKREEAKAKAIEARQKLEEGLSNFEAGLEQANAALKDSAKSPALEAALATLGMKLDDALGKAGLFRTPEALKESKEFGAAQQAAGGLAQVAAGARQAGVLDADVQGALSTAGVELQKQAAQAARDAGLGEKEAQRAGFGAVSQLLREQLNSQLQSSGRVDAALQAQLDAAKASGIEILADPAIEQLNVAKQQLDVMEKGFGVVADKVDAAGKAGADATAKAASAGQGGMFDLAAKLRETRAGGSIGGTAGTVPGMPGAPRMDFPIPGAHVMPPPAPLGSSMPIGFEASINALQKGAESGNLDIVAAIESLKATATGAPITIMNESHVNLESDPLAVRETREDMLRLMMEQAQLQIENGNAGWGRVLDRFLESRGVRRP